ncbi:MAG: Fe-S protein assembly co-chaperone HscB [Planctomycetota bacterium]
MSLRMSLGAVEKAQVCPACQAALALPYLCEGCGELLRDPPGGLSPFARFGLAPAFALDEAELERRYLDLSRRLHPDRALRRGAAQQTRALLLSSALNEAYQVLRDPRRRAEALLRLEGGKSADEDKRTPAGFLIEQLELREEVEAAQARGDEAALGGARARAASEQARCLAAAAALFGDPDFPSDALLCRVREQLNVLNYWSTFAAELAQPHA